jgi:putative membrane protein
MKNMGVLSAVVAIGLAAAPVLAMGQIDPTMNPNPGPMNPQSPQNQNIPLNQPSYPTQTGGTQANQSTSMRDSLGAPGQTGQQMRDHRFVRNATEEGIANVKLGELALQKGSPAIKQLAQTMMDDHTAINKDLATVADGMGVMLPSKMNREQAAEYEKLNRLSGKDFDTEYVTYMAHGHFQDLHLFYSEANSAADSTLQQQVLKGLRTIHDHLSLIKDTAKSADIALPPPPSRAGRPSAPAQARQ